MDDLVGKRVIVTTFLPAKYGTVVQVHRDRKHSVDVVLDESVSPRPVAFRLDELLVDES